MRGSAGVVVDLTAHLAGVQERLGEDAALRAKCRGETEAVQGRHLLSDGAEVGLVQAPQGPAAGPLAAGQVLLRSNAPPHAEVGGAGVADGVWITLPGRAF